MISPSNTNPGLTLRQNVESAGYSFDQLHPPDKKVNYFRIPPMIESGLSPPQAAGLEPWR
jgi:hypothetical protein